MKYYLLAYLAVFVAAVAQIILKIGSTKHKRLFNIFTLSGLIGMIISLGLSFTALAVLPLREMAFISPIIFILVPFFSHFILKEKISHRTFYGTGLILLGSILFNL